MKNEIISPVLKNMSNNDAQTTENNTSTCCGGAPSNKEDACCQLDEEKKLKGEEGCGCETPITANMKTSCC
ncbi:hypothetical protein [Flavobacterium sp.]|uniref:hypothetical protein n=1 Tax=Flavobacterium sp. TaxID=239 RepID=UPI003D6A957F